ncbi:hypothetical protein ACP70R_008854 [Stipagrostis hirtigluma subsp. patula]
MFELPDAVETNPCVIAAHGDSLLIEVNLKIGWDNYTCDYFVYNAGNVAAEPPRPPSLCLLPPYYPAGQKLDDGSFNRRQRPVQRGLDEEATGLLLGGGDELVVAELKMVHGSDDDEPGSKQEAEVFLFRSSDVGN